MSLTDFGTAMFLPFRPESFEVLSEVPADLVCWTTFSATFCPFPTAFSVAALVAVAAFFEVDLAFDAAFFAALAALPVVFFTVFLVAEAAFAAANTFVATPAESPAFFKSPRLAFANLATVPSFAAFSFFAVAAPTPGSDVSPEPLALLAMVSPVWSWYGPNLNLPAPVNGPRMRFLHESTLGAQGMGDLLPGGTESWHRLVPENAHHYSQLLLKRCLENRNPFLITLEDKYASRTVVEEKQVCGLARLYHWSTETTTIPWATLPERCVIKTNHWSGESLFIMDNGPEPLPGIERTFRPLARTKSGYRVIRNGRDQYGVPWPKWRIERNLRRCLQKTFPVQLEWAAANIQPRGIMAEELLLHEGRLPDDWKVHVFNGKVGFIQYDVGRIGQHYQAIYDVEGKQIPQTNPRYEQGDLPETLDGLLTSTERTSLIEAAARLAEDVDYTRVDFFLVNGRWYFGEFTNYHNSCYPQSIEWEELGGRLWLEHSL